MKYFKRRYYQKQIKRNMEKMWDFEFTKKYLLEVREGIRTEYDRLRENLDAATRRLCAEKYDLFYAADSSPVDIRTAPITPAEIETLPDAPKAEGDVRFYKKAKPSPDATICENLQKMIEKITPDIAQLQEQLKAIDTRIKGPMMDQQGQDHSIDGSMSNIMTVTKLLREHIKGL